MPRLTRKNYAKHKGVNPSTVTRWIQRGRVKVDEKGLIDVEQAEQLLLETESDQPHHQAAKAQSETTKAAQADDGAMRDERELVGMRMKHAMTRERESKAELAALELDKQAGLLLERAKVEYAQTSALVTFRSALETLPDLLSPSLAALGGDVSAIHDALDNAIHDKLRELAEGFARALESDN